MLNGRAFRAATAGLLVLVATAAAGQEQALESPVASGATINLAPGATLQFRGVNAQLLIAQTGGPQTVVTYAVDGPAEDVRVVMVTTAEGVELCTVYASTDPKKPTACRTGSRLAWGKDQKLTRVRCRVAVPAGVHVDASVEYGDIRSEAISGNVSAFSRRGNVRIIDGGGPGTIAASVGLIGNVEVLLAKVQKGPRRRMELKTAGGGDVRIGLPSSVGAKYSVITQTTPLIDEAFFVDGAPPRMPYGHVGADSDDVDLDVNTGIIGRFVVTRVY